MRDPLMERDKAAMRGFPCRLENADTGEMIGCLQDFTVNVPMEGVITVDARLLVSEIVAE